MQFATYLAEECLRVANVEPVKTNFEAVTLGCFNTFGRRTVTAVEGARVPDKGILS